MILSIQFDDQYEPLLRARAEILHATIEQAASRSLVGALTLLPSTGRVVVLSGDPLDQLGDRLGGQVLSGEDLLRKVDRLAGISYGHVRMTFSPGHLEEIAHRAERLSLTPEELIRRTVQKMEELFFTHLGVGAQHAEEVSAAR